MRVSQLILERDIYYRSIYLKRDAEFLPPDRFQETGPHDSAESSLYQLRFDPVEWADTYLRQQQKWQDRNTEISRFVLDSDEFLMFGDNSPSSLDSRLWRNLRNAKHRYAVPRSALVGKAFFIYWPQGIPFMNDGKGYEVDLPILSRYTYHQDRPGRIADPRYPSFKVPFYPQVDRMRRIR